MDLRQQQDLFLKSLLESKGLELGPFQEMLSFIRPQKGIDNAQRLKVYQRSYRNRIIKLLKEDYYVWTCLMGDEAAEDILGDYLDQHPSKEFSLAEIGCHFPQYIKENPSKYKDKKFIPDLVDFEWLLHSSFYREYDPLAQSQPYPLVLLDEESNTWARLNPSTQVFWSHWPLIKIYREEKEYPPAPMGAIAWSFQGEVKLDSIDELTFQLVKGLQKQEHLESIVESLDVPQKELPEGLAQQLEKAFYYLSSQHILQPEKAG